MQSHLHLEFAKKLQKRSTPMEAKLWGQLRSRRFSSVKFRRQCVLGPYIVDFLSVEKKLVIEVDGSQHHFQKEYDDIRTQFLHSLGYRVIRFWNNEVHQQFESVLTTIHQYLVDI